MNSATGLIGVLAAAAGAGVVLASGRASQSASLFAQLGTDNTVQLVDPTSGAAKPIYKSSADWMYSLTISPAQAYLAFIEVKRGGFDTPEADGVPRNRLAIITREGLVAVRVDQDVQRYAWCGENCVVFLKGEFHEGGVGFTPAGAFQFEVTSGRSTAISGLPDPFEVTWAVFDSALYFKTLGRTRVYRYKIATRELSETPYRDIGFSPSGRYYLNARSDEDARPRLYESKSNREVPLPEPQAYGEPSGWVFGHGDFLLLSRSQAESQGKLATGVAAGRVGSVEHSVYDVTARRVVRKIIGDIPSWIHDRRVLPVRAGARIDVISQP